MHVSGVPLVSDPHDPAWVSPVAAQHARHALEARVAVLVVLGEDGDFPRLDPTYFNQVPHRGGGLLGIACAVVEDVAIRRILAQQGSPGERPEEKHLLLERVGDGDRRGRRAHVADEAKYLLRLCQILHYDLVAARLIAVVERNQSELAAVDATRLVRSGEGNLDTGLHLPTQFLCGTGERNRLAKDNFFLGDPWTSGKIDEGVTACAPGTGITGIAFALVISGIGARVLQWR